MTKHKHGGRPYSTNAQIIRTLCTVHGCERVARSHRSQVCRIHAHDPDHCKCLKCIGSDKTPKQVGYDTNKPSITLPTGFGGKLP